MENKQAARMRTSPRRGFSFMSYPVYQATDEIGTSFDISAAGGRRDSHAVAGTHGKPLQGKESAGVADSLGARKSHPLKSPGQIGRFAVPSTMIICGRVTQNIVKTLFFTIVAPGTVGVYIPYRLRGPSPHAISVLGAFGLAPVAVGAAIYLWCAWDFAAFGRGTPFPLDAPKQLVARGLYRFVRNPMYVGVLLAIFGQALWFRSVATLCYGLAIALGFHLFVILYEEPALRRQFGESYTRYAEAVPRWIPKPAAKPAPAK